MYTFQSTQSSSNALFKELAQKLFALQSHSFKFRSTIKHKGTYVVNLIFMQMRNAWD